MNDIHHFVDQQFGRKRWLSYDSGLHRLRCTRKEDFSQIVPDVEGMATLETPIFACKFAQKKGHEHLLALANEEGELAIFDTTNKVDRIGKRAHHNAIFDLAWMYNEMRIVTVSGDHTARLLEITNDGLQIVQMFSGHTRSVKTVAFRRDDSWVFATGSRDGSILVWDIRSHASGTSIFPDNKIDSSHAMRRTVTPKRKGGTPQMVHSCVSGANSVTGMIFQDDYTLVSCGAGDGMIKFWDLRRTYTFSKREPVPKHVIPYSGSTLRNGFSNLALDEGCIKLYASCLDNSIYCYNIATYNTQPIMKFVGHQNRTYYVKACLSRDGRYLLSGSSDQYAYIWNVNNSDPIAKLKGHSAEVTCVDWCPNDTTIVTCSDDMTHKIWRLGPEIIPDNWEVEGSGVTVPLRRSKTPKRALSDSVEPLADSIKKRLKVCDKCIYNPDAYCENCNYNPKARKRLLMDPEYSESKRGHLVSVTSAPSSSKGGMSTIKEEEPTTSIPRTPCKEKEPHCLVNTPRTAIIRFDGNEDAFSPTTNLPNFVVDGNAPHLNYSPQKRVDKDWLTKISTEKRIRKRMQELTSSEPTSPQVPKVDDTPKRNSTKTPKRVRNSVPDSPKSPLLRFFKVTNSSGPKESQCSPSRSALVHSNLETL